MELDNGRRNKFSKRVRMELESDTNAWLEWEGCDYINSSQQQSTHIKHKKAK